jgi:hypothetical protein
MTVIAIKTLGVLHAIAAILCLRVALDLFALPDTEFLTRARAKYLGGVYTVTSLALVACAISAWIHPEIAWYFAFLSLVSYLPSPGWAPPRINTGRTPTPIAEQLRRYFPFVLSVRILGAILLAVAAYRLDA